MLGNYTLGVLFGLAGIRNFVFCYLDWRDRKGNAVPNWVRYFFAAVFIILTVGSTVLLVHIIDGIATVGWWLEWLICITLIGLIIGNIQKGTNLMRVSFILNRVCNIINHYYFNNLVGVIIAVVAISSNIIFYIRQFISWLRVRKV